MIYKNFIILFTLSLGLSLSYGVLAQVEPGGTSNNQVVSRDAIGLRVVPNPQHLSPLQWYANNIKVKGSPQSLVVDGYEAVRDGRTVYVNAAKIVRVNRCVNNQANICQTDSQCDQSNQNQETSLPRKLIAQVLAAGECAPSSVPELYTNIYIISYNQNPEASTADIFGQLLQYWKFNIDVKNCSKTVTQACSDGVGVVQGGCPSEETCGPTGYCSQLTTQTCMIDSDCPQGEYCNSKKATIIRDTKRLMDFNDVKVKLENYNKIVKSFPKLDTGTYLKNSTVSTWPSWSDTFSSAIGSPMPIDPVNKLGRCKLDDNENAGYNAITCWNEKDKVFAGVTRPLALPLNSRAYYYQYTPADNSYRFCTLIESGYIQAKAPLSAYCQTGKVCNVNCTNKNCGDNGCGGSCGTCTASQTCRNGRCTENNTIQE